MNIGDFYKKKNSTKHYTVISITPWIHDDLGEVVRHSRTQGINFVESIELLKDFLEEWEPVEEKEVIEVGKTNRYVNDLIGISESLKKRFKI